jgi:hypothetical protein
MESEELGNVLAAVGATASFVLALVEFAKRQGLPDRFAPVASLASGVLIIVLAGLSGVFELTWAQQAFAGLLAGLTAGGFYSGSKAIVGR